MARTQKNKATMGHLCSLKAKLAKYRTELLNPKTHGGGGGPGEGFSVAKSGDARVALIGFPSVGKSTLLSTLTDTKSEQAAYEFTTLTCIPGNIFYRGVKIQLLDLPGIIEGAAHGKGRGREVIAVAKSADLILIVLDAANEGKKNHTEILRNELESVGIRLNKTPPNIAFKKKGDGGIKFNSCGIKLTKLGDDPEKAVINILKEYKIHNADVLFRGDYGPDELIDVIEGNRKYCRCLYVWNKCDLISIEDVDRLARNDHSIVCSVGMQLNMDRLLERMWYEMGLVRVYTKKRGEQPDLDEPVVLSDWRHGTTVEALCSQLHKDMLKHFNYALVWGVSTKYAMQRCGLRHKLQDQDVIQIMTRTNQQQRRTKDYAKQVQEIYDNYKHRKKNKKALKT
eukprot:g4342.t1